MFAKKWFGSLACFTSLVIAQPTEYQVMQGDANVAHSGSDRLSIRASDRAILHWKSFSIAEGETMQFILPEASSAVLNRVVGKMPSEILGRLESNGRIYLINPQGILIGKNGVIDAHAFVASTLDLSDNAFLQNKDLHFQGDSVQSIVNLGTITTRQGGTYLVGARIQQGGHIFSKMGPVSLAAGYDIVIQPSAEKNILIRPLLDKPPVKIENSGDIQALKIDLGARGSPHTLAIQQSGHLDALNMASKKGKVYLYAEGAEISNRGKIEASTIEISSERLIVEKSSHLYSPSGEVTLHTQQLLSHEGSIQAPDVNIYVDRESAFIHTGSIEAQNTIYIQTPKFLNAGKLAVHEAGNIFIRIDQTSIETAAAYLHAPGGRIFHEANTYFSSGRYEASTQSRTGKGGIIEIFADRMDLVDAKYNASTSSHIGSISIGKIASLPSHLFISPTSQLGSPNLLHIAPQTEFSVHVEQASCCSCIPTSIGEFINPHAGGGGSFGFDVAGLPINGNVVITDPNDSFTFSEAGAAYLYNGFTGALISMLVGSHANDFVGSYQAGNNLGITVLTNGNFVISSPSWNGGGSGGLGAVTWGSGIVGVSGIVSSSNSLVGSTAGDLVGLWDNVFNYNAGAIALTNGNYVVSSPFWNGGIGAATWGNGLGGTVGPVTSINSLVGTTAGDQVSLSGSGAIWGITPLSNGNYVVVSPYWNDGRGAATLASGIGPSPVGAINSANSLLGVTPGDNVAYGPTSAADVTIFPVAALTNGNYVVQSPVWNSLLGAATWGDGNSLPGTVGNISGSNSLVGSATNDLVGSIPITVLSNGNYVVSSPNWDSNHGAATWGNGSTGTSGTISASNSLVGSTSGDKISHNGILSLTNGNYVVLSSSWASGIGAATLSSGTTGMPHGEVTTSNSLIGNAGDAVGSNGALALTNGNYVVLSPSAFSNKGAATFCLGGDASAPSPTGAISMSSSLIGQSAGDTIGSFNSIALTNGNYVITSPNWNGGFGAVTWGDGVSGTTGTVTAANSITGSTSQSAVGSSYVYPLNNGSYVQVNSAWPSNSDLFGILTWASGTGPTSEVAGVSNSLVGTHLGDYLGYISTSEGLFTLNLAADIGNGCFALFSPSWDTHTGAVSWGSDTTGVVGPVSSANSYLGPATNSGLIEMVESRDFFNPLNPAANSIIMNFVTAPPSGRVFYASFNASPTPAVPIPSHIPSYGLEDLRLVFSDVFEGWGPYFFGGALNQDDFPPYLTYKAVEYKNMPSLIQSSYSPQQEARIFKRRNQKKRVAMETKENIILRNRKIQVLKLQ